MVGWLWEDGLFFILLSTFSSVQQKKIVMIFEGLLSSHACAFVTMDNGNSYLFFFYIQHSVDIQTLEALCSGELRRRYSRPWLCWVHLCCPGSSLLLVGILLVFGEVMHNHSVHFKTCMLLGVSTCKCAWVRLFRGKQKLFRAADIKDSN